MNMEPIEIKIKIEGDSSTDSIMREVKEKLELLSEKDMDIRYLLRTLVESEYNEEYAIINGIKLKRKNEKLQCCEHFTKDESLWLAESRGLRIPTKDEWEKMIKLGYTWDDDKKGAWIGARHCLKKETMRSTFLPAAGYHPYNECRMNNVGSCSYYWSSTDVSDSVGAYYLGCNSTVVHPNYESHRLNGHSVRCIAK